jgi:outer membrane assembly lipoprotein YfgL
VKALQLALRRLTLAAAVVLAAACSSTGEPAKPAELTPIMNTIAVREAWRLPLAAPTADFEFALVGSDVVAAGRDGSVVWIDAATGRVQARAEAGRGLTAAVGAAGNLAAVVTQANELVVLSRQGQVAWRQRLPAQVLAAPLVTNDLVAVLQADQTITAFDANSGARLWANSRTQPPSLLLNRAGGLLQSGDAIYANLAQGRAAAITQGGTTRWEQTIVSARSGNEIERLVDLIGKPALVEGDLCARSFQMGVVCAQASNGRPRWNRKANGHQAIAADAQKVFATEANGNVLAFDRASGEPGWTHERLKHRGLSAPISLGRSVVFGDAFGFVHWLSRDDGSALARMPTDGTAVIGQPMIAGGTLVVRTQGGVFGFRAD